MTEVTPFWLAGQRALGPDSYTVSDPFHGQIVGEVSVPTDAQVEQAIDAASRSRKDAADLPAYARAEALDHVSRRVAECGEQLALLITRESGKPLKWARIEVARTVSTFRWAAEEARRLGGTLHRLDADRSSTGRVAVVRRFPHGPVLGIAPFNFPLNLVAHKAAPAIAIGAPIVIKPAPATPLSALALGCLLAETDLPAGMWSVLPITNEKTGSLLTDPRLPVVSFTGSADVGWMIRREAATKHVTLELGGNGTVIICPGTDIEHAAARIATYANYQGGQSCIAVQRVLVHRSEYELTLQKLAQAVEAQVTGDPGNERTDVGPLINEAAARRTESWVNDALAAGARVVTGGVREGTSYTPTVLVDVPADAKVVRDEVFGPVLTVEAYDDLGDAFAVVNSSRYGLQVGVFTNDIHAAFQAYRELEVGGVIIGDVPSYRADQMPYGGIKDSGVGREGIRSAMDDYSHERVMVLSAIAL